MISQAQEIPGVFGHPVYYITSANRVTEDGHSNFPETEYVLPIWAALQGDLSWHCQR